MRVSAHRKAVLKVRLWALLRRVEITMSKESYFTAGELALAVYDVNFTNPQDEVRYARDLGAVIDRANQLWLTLFHG